MIRTSESTKLLVAALAEFHKAEVSVPKSAENPFFHSKYADLWTIKFQCEPHLNALSLVIVQFPGITDVGQPTLITRLSHASGEFMEAETPLFMPKEDPQAQGSAITYMRRYAYCAILGIVADPDDDASVPRVKKVMERTKPAVKEFEDIAGTPIPTGFTDDPILRSGPEPSVCSPKQAAYIKGLMSDGGYSIGDIEALVNTHCPPWPDSVNNLSKKQASDLIERLK